MNWLDLKFMQLKVKKWNIFLFKYWTAESPTKSSANYSISLIFATAYITTIHCASSVHRDHSNRIGMCSSIGEHNDFVEIKRNKILSMDARASKAVKTVLPPVLNYIFNEQWPDIDGNDNGSSRKMKASLRHRELRFASKNHDSCHIFERSAWNVIQ